MPGKKRANRNPNPNYIDESQESLKPKNKKKKSKVENSKTSGTGDDSDDPEFIIRGENDSDYEKNYLISDVKVKLRETKHSDKF